MTTADADIESLKSFHTLFGKYLDHMLVKFKQNRTIRTIQNFELYDKKWLISFAKVFMSFWNSFLRMKQLFDGKQSSFNVPKNYGSPTHVTRLKVASNMADPISLNEKRL